MNRHDLDRLMETIDAQGFTALSNGLGLGETRPAQASKPVAPKPVAPTHGQIWADGYRPEIGPEPKAKPVPVATMPRPEAPRASGGFSRRVLAYGLDFLFVAMSLGVALALATLLTAVRTGETDNLLGTGPVQWVAGANPYVLLAGVYAAFLAYGLLFKVLAGRTFGETLLRLRPRASARKTREIGAGGAS